MEVFTQFSSDLDETTKRQLIYGQGLMRLLRQPQNKPEAFADFTVLRDTIAAVCKHTYHK